jgi:hypothetical protein
MPVGVGEDRERSPVSGEKRRRQHGLSAQALGLVEIGLQVVNPQVDRRSARLLTVLGVSAFGGRPAER